MKVFNGKYIINSIKKNFFREKMHGPEISGVRENKNLLHFQLLGELTGIRVVCLFPIYEQQCIL